MSAVIIPRVIRPWLSVFAVVLIFGLAYGQFPLFYFVQNQYFFHGLVRSGFGLLPADWLSGTADAWPAFTQLVHLTVQYLDPRAFYLYFLALAGVYAYSLLAIVSRLFGIDRSPVKLLVLLAVFVGLHSPVLAFLTETLLGFDVRRTFLEGVANQRILWDMLTPSAFGALLLLSIALFLRGRRALAVLALAAGAVFHPVYLLSAGVVTASYMLIVLRRGEGARRALALGALAVVAVLPVIYDTYATFRSSSPEVYRQAQRILVEFRLYQHAIPARWIGEVFAKGSVVLLGLALAWGKDLFWIMLISLTTTTVLTVAQVVSGSQALALLFPWRLSVYLVPLGTTIVAGWLVSRAVDAFERRLPQVRRLLVGASVLSLAGFVAAGGLVMQRRWQTFWGIESVPLMRFVRSAKRPGDVYLIPPLWRYFRLYTGAPVFVDFLYVPYDDRSVVEWHNRLNLSNALYGSRLSVAATPRRRATGAPRDAAARRTTAERCRALREITARYRVTHIALEEGDLDGCGGWRMLFRDGSARLYAVER